MLKYAIKKGSKTNKMKKLDKIIHWKLIEISLMLSIIMISFPLWKQLEKEELTTTASYYETANYTYLKVDKNENAPMIPLNTEEALKKLKPSTLTITNETKTREDYTILMKINKKSTLDYHCLNIAIDQWIVPLKELYQKEDEENYIFNITSNKIQGEIKEHQFIIWMDAKTNNNMMNKSLEYSFELQKGIMI